MSLIPDADELQAWAGVLERRFIAAATSEAEYVSGAKRAWKGAVKWIRSDDKTKGSFLWVCDLLELEPTAVRRALKTRDPEKTIKDLL